MLKTACSVRPAYSLRSGRTLPPIAALVFGTALVLGAVPVVFAQMPGGDAVIATAAAKTSTVARGGKGELDIVVAIKAGYHVNSVDPGDPDLIAAAVKTSGGGGITFGKAKFPQAKTIQAAGKAIRVYMQRAIIAIPFTVDKSAKPGKHVLNATFSYQTCNATMCLPPADAPVSASITVQ